jgi:trigger factor
MDITRENIDALTAVITVNLQKEEISQDVEKILKDYRRKATVPGFRPGMVPMGMIKKMYGNSIMIDELNKKVSEGLNQYFIDEQLNILGDPLPSEKQDTLDIEKQDTFDFMFDVALSPEFELKLSKRDKITFYKIDVSDDMVNQYIESTKTRFSELEEVDKSDENSLLKGNLIELDDKGNPVENGVGNPESTISLKVIKDEKIKKDFLNIEVGTIICFDLKKAFPNDTELSALLNIDKDKLSAIKGDFQLTVSEIKTMKPAELNEELFSKVFGDEVKTEEEFRERIVSEIAKSMEADSKYKFMLDAREKLIGKVGLEMPESFLKRWVISSNKELTDEQIEKEFPRFIEDLQWTLIKGKLAKENEISVEAEELKAEAKKSVEAQFKQYGMSYVPEQYLTQYADEMMNKEEERKQIYEKVMDEKILDFVFEAVKIEEKIVTSDDFRKMFE